MLGENFQWLGNDLVTVTLGIATAAEVGGYYIPWVDNALDAIATPIAIVAGTFISGVVMPEAMGDGSLKWIIAMIAGGGPAGLVQGTSVVTRGASTTTTGGIGNPAVSSAELGGALLTSLLAIFVPILAAILVLFLICLTLRKFLRFFKHRKAKKS